MLEQIRRDKWKHFIVGVAMGLLLEALLLWLVPEWRIIGSAIVLFIIIVISYLLILLRVKLPWLPNCFPQMFITSAHC